MSLLDLNLHFVIENPKGSYKKFVDSLDEYPLLGVTFPTHYGYINGYMGEDTADLDMFLGSGDQFGVLKVNRDDVEGGIETKLMLYVTDAEYDAIAQEYAPVINQITKVSEDTIEQLLPSFKK